MDDELYKEIILEHWKHPHHYGEVTNADIDVTDLNPLCGDEIHITLKRAGETIEEIAFTAEGCAISKAGASILMDITQGKSIEEFKKITPKKFLAFMGVTLTPARTKCALLGYSTLQKAIT